MKRLGIVVIGLVVIAGGITLTNKKVEYTAPEVVEVEKEVQVDALEQAIKASQTNKESEIKAIADKAYQDAYTQEMKKVELEVIAEFNKKLDARQIELEKETKVY
jgi:outer membrane murein-binding lipoprotein Lpp